ncbi:hypothetical protein LTS08_002134 [Lithohypha guttulata]|uniref:uncharacterized protein n=1 Tax=Lithohypha guttulata TaxID=1690604 RepID=UPI002DDFE1AA|nr:hypothetical protein LTR51_004348 [Lithohypha guttulata]KAK5104247.1 hypothetical protein LTS08_002134 [Lithohypha guttulata]
MAESPQSKDKQPQPRPVSSGKPVQQPQEPNQDLVLIDQYGMPAEDSTVDWSHTVLSWGDREEAEAKSFVLGKVFYGEIVRWREDEWRQGLYGHPSDPQSRSRTGWVVKRHNSPQQAFTGPTIAAPANSFPSLPELEGDDSFIREADDFIAQLNRGNANSVQQPSSYQGIPGQTAHRCSHGPVVSVSHNGPPRPVSEGDRQLIRDYKKRAEERKTQFRIEREREAKARKIPRTASEEALEKGRR